MSALDAVYSTASDCGNRGLNVARDMAGLSAETSGELLGALGLGGLVPVVESVPPVGNLLVGIARQGDGLLMEWRLHVEQRVQMEQRLPCQWPARPFVGLVLIIRQY